MKASSHRLIVASTCLAALALASPVLQAQVRMFGEVDAHLYRGTALLEQGRTADAEREWLAAATLAPRNPTAHHALGSLYLASGRWAEARTAFHRFADLDPMEPHTLCVLAERELAVGTLLLLDASAWDASRAAALEPLCRRAQTVAANAWLAKGDTRRGIEHLRRVVRLEPGNPAAALRLGKLLLRNQRLEEATDAAERLAARYPAMSAALALQGACYRQHPPESEKARRAEGALARALELDPLNGEAHAALGLHQLVQGRPGSAVRYLEAAQLLNVRDVSLPFNLARAYRALGRTREAVASEEEFASRNRVETEVMALEKRLAAAPTDAATLARLVELSSRINDPERAARYRRWAGVAETNAAGETP